MRVLLVSVYDTSQSGGLSTFVKLYAQGLRAAGHQPVAVDERSIPAWQRLVALRIIRNVLYLLYKDWGMRWYFWSMQRLIAAAAQKQLTETAVIHAQDPLALCALLHASQPKVLTVHGDLANMCRSDNVVVPGGKAEQEAVEIERTAYKQANKVITVDTRLHNHVRDLARRDVTIIKNFIDTNTFVPLAEPKRAKLRKKLGLSGFAVFCPRRLVPKNGVIFAANAMRHLKNADVLLVYAGSGSEMAKIKEIIATDRTEKQVRLLGDIPHDRILEYYQACDAVLIPSVTSEGVIEATSIAALEGMGCERPVIASNIGGLAELLRHNKTGILVPEQDEKAIAKAIRTVQNAAFAKRLGKAARRFVLKNHSVDSQTRKYLAQLRKVAK